MTTTTTKATITDWTAKRSGSALTIEGKDGDGKTIKVGSVAKIYGKSDPTRPTVLARTTGGAMYELA